MKLKPTRGRVLVRPSFKQRQGSIHLPERGKAMPTAGIVVAVGDILEDISEGDHVCWYPNVMQAYDSGYEPFDEQLFFLDEHVILAKIERS